MIKDQLGEARQNFPLSFYIAGGTQAAKVSERSQNKPKLIFISSIQIKDNELFVTRFVNIHGIDQPKEDKDDDEESSSSEEDEDDSDEENEVPKRKRPILHTAIIPHYGDINRIKVSYYLVLGLPSSFPFSARPSDRTRCAPCGTTRTGAARCRSGG